MWFRFEQAGRRPRRALIAVGAVAVAGAGLVAVAVPSFATPPSQLYVSSGGTDSASCGTSTTNTCATIDQAIANAAGTATIDVGTGSFAGFTLSVGKAITITAPGGATLTSGSSVTAGSLVLESITVDTGGGTGLAAAAAPVAISDSTFTGNGAGLSVSGSSSVGATATVMNSTFYGNSVATNAGPYGTISLTYVTLANNGTGSLSSGGGSVPVGLFDWTADVYSGNQQNCQAGGTDHGYNFEAGYGCPFTASTSQVNVSLPAGTFGDNGGPTSTLPPVPTNPAVDAIPTSSPLCTGADQRGVSRPQASGCDAGAVELVGPSSITVAPSASPNPSTVTQQVTISATVSSSLSNLPTPQGTLEFDYGTTALCANVALDSTGTGSCQTTSLPPGTDTVAVDYSGTNGYATQSGTTSVTVNRAAPTLTGAVSATSAPPGMPITDTATLSGGQGPTGTITFDVYTNDSCGGTPAFSSTVAVNGAGMYTSGELVPVVPGTYHFVATYDGDANNASASAGCADPAETFTVGQLTPTITWSDPAPITYGTALSATQLDATADVPGTFTYTPGAGTVLGAGTQTLSVQFTPTDSTTYSTATKTVNIVVGQASPTVAWTTPAPITYGTALSATQLDATADVPGTFTYTPGAGTVLGAGSQTLSVQFTPADTTDYTGGSQTVTLTVNKASPTVTWTTPAPITYGTALSATQLDATADVPGTFTYTPGAGTVLGAGSQTLSVQFTPSDTVDYTDGSQTVTLTVNKASPTVTWTTPAAITYGTALSATQLDATADVPGTFTYTPGAGTVLDAGSHTLSVQFTPTDTTDYTDGSQTVTLTVNKAAQSITFGPLGTVRLPHAPITLTATASSTLAVTYSVTGPCTVSGSALTLTGAGACVVTANQSGNGNYLTATPVQQTLTILPPFELTVSGSADFTAGHSGSVTFTATGSASPTFQESGTLPAGLSFTVTGDQATVSGTPQPGSGGAYPISVTATASEDGATATQSLTLTVREAPAITSADHTTFTALRANSFTVTTHGGWPVPAVVSASGLPANVTLSDNGDGTATLSGTPRVQQSGAHTFTITACNADSSLCRMQSFTLTVRAPVVTAPAKAPVGDGLIAGVQILTAPGSDLQWTASGFAPGAPVTLAFYDAQTYRNPVTVGVYYADAHGDVRLTGPAPNGSGIQYVLAAGYAKNGTVRYLTGQTRLMAP